MPIPPTTGYGGYPAAARDYTYYGAPPVKRHRTSVDYGRQGIYDADGRMARQMDPSAYGQPAAAIYAGQPGTYPTQAMPSYAGQVGGVGQVGQVVPDYGVRMTSSLDLPFTNASQMYSNMQPSAPMTQIPDPSGQSRSSQQAAVGQLMAMNQPGTPVRHPSANQ